VRILTRYILREVLSLSAIGITLFTFVIFMPNVGRILELAVRNSAPLSRLAQLVLLTLPGVLAWTVPMGVLVGILIALSRLAADSEVTAMRASGIGAGLFLRVIVMFAAAAWLVALVNTLWIAPRSAAAFAGLQDQLKNTQAPFEVQPRVFYEDFKNYVLYVQDTAVASDAVVWKRVFLADLTTPSAPKLTLAEQGVVVNESPTTLRLELSNGWQHEVDPRAPKQYIVSQMGNSVLHIDLPESVTPAPGSLSYSEMSNRQLLDRARTGTPAQANWSWVELHRRLALPTSCLVLALVGIPLGLSAHKGGKSTGFVLTFLLVFVYYFLWLTGVSLGRQGELPPGVSMWMANAVFLVGGVLLYRRVNRMPIEIGSLRGAFAWMRQHILHRAEKAGGGFERVSSPRRVFGGGFPQILDEYVLRDFFTYFGLVLSTFVLLTLLFTLFELLSDIIRNRVPLVTVGEYLLNFLPSVLYVMTPLSVLIAVLVTFGLMEKANEITAMKANGISLYRVIVPVLAVGMMLAASLFFFEQYYLPGANKRQDALWSAMKGKPPQTYLRADRKWIFGQHSSIFYYEFFDPDRNQFGRLAVFQFDPQTLAITRRIYANNVRWDDDLQGWVFAQGWERAFRGSAIEKYEKFDVRTFPDITEPPSYFKKEVKQSSEMNYAELSRYIDDLKQSGFDVVRLRVQLHKKLAYPLITFVMAVLAIPFSLSAGRRGAIAGVAMAIGIAVIYWVASGFFESLGNVGALPPALAAWSPDLLFALLGGYFIFRLPT
jgi:LPS export ABC transporter permease LptG/LPS export ABC transporter permease LptF